MPINFESNQSINLKDYELELDFAMLGIDNVYINLTKYMQIEKNSLLFLNKNKISIRKGLF